jgi:hypothetical protein
MLDQGICGSIGNDVAKRLNRCSIASPAKFLAGLSFRSNLDVVRQLFYFFRFPQHIQGKHFC